MIQFANKKFTDTRKKYQLKKETTKSVHTAGK